VSGPLTETATRAPWFQLLLSALKKSISFHHCRRLGVIRALVDQSIGGTHPAL